VGTAAWPCSSPPALHHKYTTCILVSLQRYTLAVLETRERTTRERTTKMHISDIRKSNLCSEVKFSTESTNVKIQ